MKKLLALALLLAPSLVSARITSILTLPAGNRGEFQFNNGNFDADPEFSTNTVVTYSSASANFISYSSAAVSYLGISSAPSQINLSNPVTGTLPNANIDGSSVTLRGNSFNGANELILADSSGLVPNANIDSSSVTKLGASIDLATEVSGTIPGYQLGGGSSLYLNIPTTGTLSAPFGISGSSASFSSYEGTSTDNSTTTYTGTNLFSSSTSIKGTTTNNNAAAGYVGESTETITTTQINAPTTDQWGDLGQFTLTSGDWDISYMAYVDRTGATWSGAAIFIGTVAGNDATGRLVGYNGTNESWASSSSTPVELTISIPKVRVSINSSTTYYAKIRATYSASGPPRFAGVMSARRVR